jgi:hypothetical protein
MRCTPMRWVIDVVCTAGQNDLCVGDTRPHREADADPMQMVLSLERSEVPSKRSDGWRSTEGESNTFDWRRCLYSLRYGC